MARTDRRGNHTGSGRECAQAWIEEVLSHLGSTIPVGRSGKWQCPVHARTGEHAASLMVGSWPDGAARVHCFAGCTVSQISQAVGLTLDQLRCPPRISPARWVQVRRLPVGFPAPKAAGSPRRRGFRYETTHGYGTRFRLERWRHPMTGEKAMEWWARNDRGEWVPGLLGTREADLPLYREHEVRAAVALGETVLVVESESSADALTGWYATTWAGGAGAPPCERIAALLADHPQVVIVGDTDDPGRACAARLSEVLPRAAVLFSQHEGEDARDLHRRLGADRFAELIAAALTGRAETPAA